MKTYAKTVAAVLAAAISAVVAAWTRGGAIEWTNVAVAAAAAISVHRAPNTAGGATKAELAAVGAALTAAVDLIGEHAPAAGWWQVAVAVLGAAGVYSVPSSTGGAATASSGVTPVR